MFPKGVGSQPVRPSDVSLLSSNGHNAAFVQIIRMDLLMRGLRAIAGMRIGKLCRRGLPILMKITILGAAIPFDPGMALAAVPTLVQHVATGMDRWPLTSLTINLPNHAGAGNALILGLQFKSAGSVSSIVDNKGNNWVAGPSVVSGTFSQKMIIYYCLNVAGGTQNIVVTFNGLTKTVACPQAVLSEFRNIATAAALDGSVESPLSLEPGTIDTKQSGDLIYQWGVDFSDTNSNGGAFNGDKITAGQNFRLLSADLQVGSADQYYVQPSAGSISPRLTASGSSTWGSVALALKSALAGTGHRPGIHIVRVQHTLLAAAVAQGRTTPIVMQFPSSGNLLVGMFNSGDVTATSISDNAHNNWVSAAHASETNVVSQIFYAANASTSRTLGGINVTLSGKTGSDITFILYDVAGAAAEPLDEAVTASGDQTSGGNLITVSLTPTTNDVLVFNQTAIDLHTINGLVGPGFVLDAIVNAYDNDDPQHGGTNTSTLDEDNGYGHIYTKNPIPELFVYTYTHLGAGVQTWGSASVAFKPAH